MAAEPVNIAYYNDVSLAFHREIARRLRADPSLLATARGLLAERIYCRWSDHLDSANIEWSLVLVRDAAAVAAIIEAEDVEGQRLRQATPVLSMLPSEDRKAIRTACATEWLAKAPPEAVGVRVRTPDGDGEIVGWRTDETLVRVLLDSGVEERVYYTRVSTRMERPAPSGEQPIIDLDEDDL